ncbi:cation diffusion facilitator CzcD-associated flavoprotein CzcO [Streptacidiphilus sp. BW17]|jgi:lysine/ornithine N-monooxygenase|uniref:FAD-dependent oxidoreductase n=1 Tax=Streptacidiphilus sp. BW17 TaxID=3156274 RepID=UPI003514662E
MSQFSSGSSRTVAVIGAGPYGLSVAAHLRATGLAVRAFGDPMYSWRDTMPVGMNLKSTPDASNISAPTAGYRLDDYCRTNGGTAPSGHDRVPVDLFVRYGQWFQQQAVPFLERENVRSVRQNIGGGFRLELDGGEAFDAAAVVVASGLTGFAHIPGMLRTVLGADGPSPDGPLSHTSQHRDMAALAGRSVIVVGAGQSALEGAALLHEAGAQVELVARTPHVRFGAAPAYGLRWQPESPMGAAWSLWTMARYPQSFRALPVQARLQLVKRVLGPSGAWWLRARADGVFPVHTGQSLRGIRREGDKVVLITEDRDSRATREHTADHVLSATGYRVDLSAVPFLAPELRGRIARVGGFPELDAGMAASVPGLWFTGLPAAASFGPFMRFVCGTDFASTRIAEAVRARLA